jgi:hypothetical protein
MNPANPRTPLNPADLIRQEAELIEAGLTLQTQGMQLLLAEMRALAGLIPGADVIPEPASDSETEAGFDNMPV